MILKGDPNFKEDDVRHKHEVMLRLRGQPNVVSLHDIFEVSDHVSFIMDLCCGRNLFDFIAQQHPAGCSEQLFNAVRGCSEQIVLHRARDCPNHECYSILSCGWSRARWHQAWEYRALWKQHNLTWGQAYRFWVVNNHPSWSCDYWRHPKLHGARSLPSKLRLWSWYMECGVHHVQARHWTKPFPSSRSQLQRCTRKTTSCVPTILENVSIFQSGQTNFRKWKRRAFQNVSNGSIDAIDSWWVFQHPWVVHHMDSSKESLCCWKEKKLVPWGMYLKMRMHLMS